MSVIINSNRNRFNTADDFILYNPWFTLALDNCINSELESNRFKYKIRDEINNQFPTLWRSHMLSDPEWNRLKDKLNTHTDSCVQRVNTVVDNKVQELVNSDKFEPLCSSINTAVQKKYQLLESEMKYKNRLEEESRNLKLTQLERKITYVIFILRSAMV